MDTSTSSQNLFGKPTGLYSPWLNRLIGVLGLALALTGAAIYPLNIEWEGEGKALGAHELGVTLPADLVARLPVDCDVRVKCGDWPGGDREFQAARVVSLGGETVTLRLHSSVLQLEPESACPLKLVMGQETVWQKFTGESRPLGFSLGEEDEDS